MKKQYKKRREPPISSIQHMNNRDHQKAVIQAVLDRYNDGVGTAYVITRWPDEEERNNRACDAFAEMKGSPAIAIEHTLIQSYDRQKQRDAEFMQAIGELEQELRNAFPYRIRLGVRMFAVEKGQRWDALKRAIRSWLTTNVPVPGRTDVTIPGVPFPVSIIREEDGPTGFTVFRWYDESLDISEGLRATIAAALENKNNQLGAYRTAGNRTILVLESEDVALANRVLVYRAFLATEKAADMSNIDQVWLASTITQENYVEVYCMRAPQVFIDAVNPPNVLFGPDHGEVWDEPIAL